MGHGALQLLSVYTNTPVRGWAYAPGAEHGACARAGSPTTSAPTGSTTCADDSAGLSAATGGNIASCAVLKQHGGCTDASFAFFKPTCCATCSGSTSELRNLS